MSVIPWVACNPSRTSSDGDELTAASAADEYRHHDGYNSRNKPLFLFLEGTDAHDTHGGLDNAIPGNGGYSAGNPAGGHVKRRRRSSSRLWKDVGGASKKPSKSRLPGDASLSGTNQMPLPLRPLEVVVYASLSFRNLLPVRMGWRVVGARGDPEARVAEGSLAPGEGAHVLEANTMAMTPSLSFQARVILKPQICGLSFFLRR